VSRPRLSSDTEELIDRVDELSEKHGVGKHADLQPLKGRGNGSNNFTKDSIIKDALERRAEELENLDQFLENMKSDE